MLKLVGSGVAEWARALTGDRTVNGSSPAAVKTFRFGTLAIPFTPPCQCLSDETRSKSRWSLLILSGVYARGSKRSHQSALECVPVTVVDSTSHSKSPNVR